MFKRRPIVLVLSACLLQACVAPPTRQEMSMQPVLRVRHSSDQTAATYYQLGKYHQERGNLDLALAAYTHSIALDSRQLEARNAIAAIQSKQGKLDEAKAVLLQLIADYPAVAHPYNNLGYVYYLQGNFDAAVTTLQRALALDTGNERARNNLKMAEAAVQAVATNIVSPPAIQRTAKLEEPAISSTPAPRTPERVIMNSPSTPQARMEVVQIVPNVFVLQQKAAPVVATALSDKTVVAAAAPAPVTVTASARVEVANGNGVTGMAKRMKSILGPRGIAVTRLTNAPPYMQKETKIQYRAGYEQAAEALKVALRGYAVMTPNNHLSGNSDVRLVLGKDAVARMAQIEGSGGESLLALNGQSH